MNQKTNSVWPDTWIDQTVTEVSCTYKQGEWSALFRAFLTFHLIWTNSIFTVSLLFILEPITELHLWNTSFCSYLDGSRCFDELCCQFGMLRACKLLWCAAWPVLSNHRLLKLAVGWYSRHLPWCSCLLQVALAWFTISPFQMLHWSHFH